MWPNRSFAVLWLTLAWLILAGCGGGTAASSASPTTPPANSPPPPPAPPPTPPPPPPPPAAPARVFLIVMENQSFEAMVGSPEMPYLNSVIPQGAKATGFFANTHPSIGNYFMLTTGQIITNDSNFNEVVTVNNLVRVLAGAQKNWKAYIEDLPAIGYTGGNALPYVKRHNPFAYFSDVLDNVHEANKMVPYTHFAADLAAGDLPDFVYILPNQINNMHDCAPSMPACTNADRLRAGDDWLRANLQPLLDSPTFRQRPTLLIFTLDESEPNDTRNGGGRVVTLLLGSKAKVNFETVSFHQHQSLLRLMLEVLDIPERPGASQNAPSMTEFLR